MSAWRSSVPYERPSGQGYGGDGGGHVEPIPQSWWRVDAPGSDEYRLKCRPAVWRITGGDIPAAVKTASSRIEVAEGNGNQHITELSLLAT